MRYKQVALTIFSAMLLVGMSVLPSRAAENRDGIKTNTVTTTRKADGTTTTSITITNASGKTTTINVGNTTDTKGSTQEVSTRGVGSITIIEPSGEITTFKMDPLTDTEDATQEVSTKTTTENGITTTTTNVVKSIIKDGKREVNEVLIETVTGKDGKPKTTTKKRTYTEEV